MSEKWLSEVVAIPSQRRTWKQWWNLGEHHAQSAIARSFNGLPPGTRKSFLEAVIAAGSYEGEKLGLQPEIAYWIAYVQVLTAEVTSPRSVYYQPRPTLVVNNAQRQAA